VKIFQKYEIGQKILKVPTYEKSTKADIKMGEIVYIHPQERFYVVEFEGKLGRFREAYFIHPAERSCIRNAYLNLLRSVGIDEV